MNAPDPWAESYACEVLGPVSKAAIHDADRQSRPNSGASAAPAAPFLRLQAQGSSGRAIVLNLCAACDVLTLREDQDDDVRGPGFGGE